MLLKPVLLAPFQPTKSSQGLSEAEAAAAEEEKSDHLSAAITYSIAPNRKCSHMVDLFIPEKAKYYLIPFWSPRYIRNSLHDITEISL
jgi:hypothetical protein